MDQEGHDRVTDDRTDDPCTNDLAEHSTDQFSFGSTIEYPGEKRAKDSACECQRRDSHKGHTNDSDQGGTEQRIPRPHEHGTGNVDEMRHGTHPLDAKNGRDDHPNGDQHGQHRHSKNFCLTFHDFLSFRPAVIALDYDGTVERARWVDSARIVGRSRLKSLLSP